MLNKGVHGQTVGIRVVDFVPPTTGASKVRWSCVDAIAEEISIRDIQLLQSKPPAGCEATPE
eukprot:SAG22_NODE_13807_length_394_cov_0.861017_1_plen_61_part_01